MALKAGEKERSKWEKVEAEINTKEVEGAEADKEQEQKEESEETVKSQEEEKEEEKEVERSEPVRMFTRGSQRKALKRLSALVVERAEVEARFVKKVGKLMNEEQRQKMASTLKAKDDPGTGLASLLLDLAPGEGHADKVQGNKHVYLLDFSGDVQASQVKNLSQEITAVLRSANKERGDEVLLKLGTGGGTVSGYGLAGAQLQRLKDAGIKLTICVDQIAASGGYMMACLADRLVASPFATLGSIGVVTDIPNLYDRLDREGVEFLTITAGQYKRTVTPFKKPDEEDIAKVKADLEQVWALFKDWVGSNRPVLDINEVATGETWLGKDALKLNLVDQLSTSDEVMMEKMKEGADIFYVRYSPPPVRQSLLGPRTEASDMFAPSQGMSWQAKLATWLLNGNLAGLQGSPGLGGVAQGMTNGALQDAMRANNFAGGYRNGNHMLRYENNKYFMAQGQSGMYDQIEDEQRYRYDNRPF